MHCAQSSASIPHSETPTARDKSLLGLLCISIVYFMQCCQGVEAVWVTLEHFDATAAYCHKTSVL